MKRNIAWLALLLSVCLCAGCAVADTAPFSPEEAAKAVLSEMIAGDYAAVEAKVDESIKSQLTAAIVGQGWETMTAALGDYVETANTAAFQQGEFTVIQMLLTHARGQQTMTLAFTKAGAITGFFLQPIPETQGQEETPLPLPEGAAEEPIALRPGAADETGGFLTVPAGEGPFPAVVLIHGSGPSDRDETVYGLKPFRDLAMGLAAQGVASVRYDKYTFAHAELSASATIETEYERDVSAAVSLLKADPRFSGVYLLGHSEGGMLLPRLLDVCEGAVNGGVILAGSPRAFWEIQLTQNEAMLEKLPTDRQAAARELIDAEAAKGKRLNEMDETELAAESVFGISAAYQKDVASVDPIATAKALRLPLLILQGEKDFQVLPGVDFAAWQTGLSGDPFATFKLYPGLTHLFTALEGDSTGTTEDYTHGGHVSPDVSADIAAWILAQP